MITDYQRFAPTGERLAFLEVQDADAVLFIACGKCDGTGYLTCFGHVHEGICFDCNGARGTTRTVKRERANVKASIRREAKRQAADAERRAAQDATRAQWTAANPDLALALDAYTGRNDFLRQLADTARIKGELSEKQADAARAALQREVDEAAAAAPVVEGTVEVVGEVLSIKWQDNDFGGREVMTVRDDRGFMVWGSVPAAIEGVERGQRVAFTASVSKSDTDDTFGFFKRPRKATIQEEVQA